MFIVLFALSLFFFQSADSYGYMSGNTSHWIPCGSEGQICHIDVLDIIYNDTRYYTPREEWNTILVRFCGGNRCIYKYMSAYSNAFYCDTNFFKNPTYGTDISGISKTCEYKIIDRVNPGGKTTILDPNKMDAYLINNDIGGGLRFIKYSCGPSSYVNGWVYIKDEFLGPVIYYENGKDIKLNKICGNTLQYVLYETDLTKSFSNWKFGANEGAYFTLPMRNRIYNIMFGTFRNNTYSLYPIRYPTGVVTMVSGDGVWCREETLSHNKVYYVDYPDRQRSCMYNIQHEFGNTTGRWQSIGSCNSENCTLSYTLSEGIILSDGESTSMSYAESLTKSTSEHMNFFGLGASQSMTTATSQSITNIVSGSYSRQYSKASTATCKGTVMYQWVQDTDEICTEGICKIYVYTLNYICISSFNEPKCPLTKCLDSNCQTCDYY